MKFNGLKHLNSNWYDYIMIRNLNIDEIKVNIKNELKIDTLKNKKTFYDTIKHLSEKEKIKEIIRYYLRNNKIYCLNDKCQLSHYNGYFTVIEGERNLYLQLKEKTIDKEILDEIIKKYITDRYEYLFNNDFGKIDIGCSYKESSYYIDIYRNEVEKVLNINLKENNKKLLSFEENFIMNYINYLFNKTEKEIYFRSVDISIYMYKHYETLNFGEFPGLYFYNDDFIIKVNNGLLNKIYPLMINHNKMFKESKKLQLTINDLQK